MEAKSSIVQLPTYQFSTSGRATRAGDLPTSPSDSETAPCRKQAGCERERAVPKDAFQVRSWKRSMRASTTTMESPCETTVDGPTNSLGPSPSPPKLPMWPWRDAGDVPASRSRRLCTRRHSFAVTSVTENTSRHNTASSGHPQRFGAQLRPAIAVSAAVPSGGGVRGEGIGLSVRISARARHDYSTWRRRPTAARVGSWSFLAASSLPILQLHTINVPATTGITTMAVPDR